MRFRVKDYCRIILYLPSEEKLKVPPKKEKPLRIEEDVDMRLSEDEAPMEPEDATHTSAHQRPPSYNPEDYAHAIAKYARSPNLYAQDHRDKKNRGKEREKSNLKEGFQEMTLKQFASLPELLRRLREDLKTAYVSFVKELVREPHDGVSLLLDLLKMIQLAQSNLNGNPTNREQQIALRRALIDEFECLSCLRCCLRCSDSASRIANYRNGLYCLAAATMSSLTRSRTLALQLLTKACDNSSSGHRQVVEAFSTLRLRFSEPVRCKFLVSMMLSHPHPSFQVWAIKFLNSLVGSSGSLRERVYLQEEIMEAGFDVSAVKKAMEHRGTASQTQLDSVMAQLKRWSEGYIDLMKLEDQLTTLKSVNSSLHQELQNIRQSNMKLLEENVLLKAVGGEVEERCSALKRRLEHHGIPSAPSPVPSVTDSEVSSFATAGRNTIKRSNSKSPVRSSARSISPSRFVGTMSTVDGGMSISPDWTMVRPTPQECNPNRHVSNTTVNNMDANVPTPNKRPVVDLPEAKRSENPETQLNGNQLSIESHRKEGGKDNLPPYDVPKSIATKSSKTSTTTTEEKESKNLSRDTKNDWKQKPNNIMSATYTIPETSRKSEEKHQQNEVDEPIYQSPIRVARKGRGKTKKSDSREEITHVDGKIEKASSNSTRSLSSSTSSLSAASSIPSFDGGDRTDPQYENVPKKNLEKIKPKCGDEGEVDYERDVVVYEAITIRNDTILMDKTSTHGSKGSSKSSHSQGSKETDSTDDGINVRQSVIHYENLAGMKEKPDYDQLMDAGNSQDNIKPSDSNHSGENEKANKQKNSRKDKINKKTSKKDSRNSKNKFDDVSEGEVEAVMNGLESILRSAESSLSAESEGTVKENPLLKAGYEDRASPENPISEIEIVHSRAPPIPPRTRSRDGSSHSSGHRTPNSVVYLGCDSPAETSDTDTFRTSSKHPSSGVDSESTRSFGWHRGETSVRRHGTFMDKTEEKLQEHHSRRQMLRRSESFHTSNASEYNSHRSYSPRRRSPNELKVPLEEREVHINGRTYTKYTAHEVEHRNLVNSLLNAEARRRNRSIDDRLDRWLDQDCMRQKALQEMAAEAARQSKRKLRPIEDLRKSSRAKNSENKNFPSKPHRNAKSRFSLSDLTAFTGFKNPNAAMRESDYGPNFMLTNSGYQNRLGDALGDLVDSGNPRPRNNRTKRKIIEDPDIPTPDYSATPAGTLTNQGPSRHILDMPSGLY